MGLIADLQLNKIRAAYTASLPDDCDIRYKASVSDGQGGHTENWESSRGTVSCRLAQPSSGDGALTVGTLREGMPWTLYLAYGQTVALDDRVLISGHTYHVISVNDDESEKFCKVVSLERRG